MDRLERERRALAAARLTGELAHAGVVLVALPWVDNSGVVRTKAVPIDRLERAAAWGVGASPVFDAFAPDDTIVTGRCAGGPVGDLRLMPDLDRVTILAALPGGRGRPSTGTRRTARFTRRMPAECCVGPSHNSTTRV